jgi:hypothetical protein
VIKDFLRRYPDKRFEGGPVGSQLKARDIDIGE